MSDHEARGRAVYDHTDDDPRPSGRRRRPAADWGVGEELFDRMPGRRFGRDDHPRGQSAREDREGREDQPRSAAARAEQLRSENARAENARAENARADVPRGGAEDGRRTIVITGAVRGLPPTGPDTTEEFTSREEALRARRQNEALWGAEAPAVWRGDEPFVGRREAAGHDEPAPDAAGGADERARRIAAPVDERVRRAGEAGDEAGAPPDRAPDPSVHGGHPGRRTVKIGGRPDDRFAFDRPPRRRPPRTVGERVGPRPDRVAAWAFALGLLLILVAVATAAAGA